MFSIFASKAGKTRKIAKQLLEFSVKVDLYRRDVIPPADLAEQLKGARQESQQLIVEAEQEVDKLYREALALAQAEANTSREQARRDIEQQRDQAMAALGSQSDRLGDLIVNRLLPAR